MTDDRIRNNMHLPSVLLAEDVVPSTEQRPAVLNRGEDVVVTAGAGAGKTRTLVGRFVSLLFDGYPLRSIVAITFTRKAAREMRIRIREVIHTYQIGANLDPAERNRWQQIYLALDSARIGTIHSLCAEIIRSHPAEAAMDPAFKVLEEGQAAQVQRQALEAGLAFAASQETLAPLFVVYGEYGLLRVLSDLLANRLDAVAAFAAQPSSLETVWQQHLKRHREEALHNLVNNPAWQQAAAVLQTEQAADVADRLEEQRVAACQALVDFQAAGDPALLQPIADIKLNAGRRSAWPGGADQQAAVKIALKDLRELWTRRAPAVQRSLNHLDAQLIQTLPLLRSVFEAVLTRYSQLKAQENALDFDDLEMTALNLLQNQPHIRQRWQNNIRSILVDEFQDTNARQRDLLDLLNGEQQKLFIVGDGKQSIYRFRGADVSVFRQKKAGITHSGAHYGLTESYRAHRALIGILNGCMRAVLGEEEMEDASWVEPFSPLTYVREQAEGCQAPYLEFHLTAGAKVDGALDRAADALVDRIRDIVNASDGQLRYDDVAILCRASTSFSAYEDALDRAGISYITVSGRGFYERPEIRDVLNALKALADPTDDLALVGMLRSPVIGLSDMTIYELVRSAREEKAENLWAFLCSHQHNGLLKPHVVVQAARLQKTCDLIASLHASVGRVTVSNFLKHFLDITDYRAALMRIGNSRGVHNLSKLLYDAHASGRVGVNAFLGYVQGLRDSGSREGEAAILSTGAVRIMTVHAAKGLEFGVVAIGDAGRKTLNRNGLLIDPDFGVLPVLVESGETKRERIIPAVYEIARERDRRQEEAESDRMLYVAATRVKEKLLVSGCVNISKLGNITLSGWLGRLAGGDNLGLYGETIEYDPEGNTVHEVPLTVNSQGGSHSVGCFIYEPYYKSRTVLPEHTIEDERGAQPPFMMLDTLVPETVVVDEKTQEEARQPPRKVWRIVPSGEDAGAPGWVTGTLVHQALSRWTFPGEPGFARWLEVLTAGCGVVDVRARQNAVRHASQLLVRFLTSDLYRVMMSADIRMSEVPYTVLDEMKRLEYGRIDALYRIGNQWHLVEFKADSLPNRQALESVLVEKDYVVQMGRYLDAAESLLADRPAPHMCFLNVGGVVVDITDRW
ncbi:MAG: UvrD-helicase domain-containing protein [Anaerolineae bacterium]|nr:UvrD-helicase domain-containing protein [Anaerolineae bacterium]